jgi:uncharacterized damage-inducible protein DinB
MARYNAWANLRVLQLVARLSDQDYRADMGLFFRSIHQTLNHVLAMDRLWISRITLGLHAGDIRPDRMFHRELAELRAAREAEDDALTRLCIGFDAEALLRPIAYRTLAGDEHVARLGDLLWNMFNHQTHHRGQIHAVLTRLAIDPPPLDVIYFLVEEGSAGPAEK